jgi:hypothetical protein
MYATLSSEVRERLTWFQCFMPLYEKADPIIRAITSIQLEEDGEVPLSPELLAECSMTLSFIRRAVRELPDPGHKELRGVKREFENALASCMKAGETISRNTNFGRSSAMERIRLIGLLNSIVLAHEYIESVSRRLNPLA